MAVWMRYGVLDDLPSDKANEKSAVSYLERRIVYR